MKKILFAAAAVVLAASCAPKEESMQDLTERVFAVATEQVKLFDSLSPEDQVIRTVKDGELVMINKSWWCSGFFPGTCWYVYEQTGDETVKDIAVKNTLKLAGVPSTVNNHDLGFMFWCSYGNALRLTGDESYKPTILEATERLMSRYCPAAKTIQSWNKNPELGWDCPVIIDNMMNLELLEEAAKLFGEPKYAEIARTHANTTLANHFRPDFTTYHVVDYNPETGEVHVKQTRQGYADESCWARGEAWALYGFTMMYRETSDEAYLLRAQNVADWIIAHLPADYIPYWDYDVPNIENEPRDASAGAIYASALIELSTFTADKAKAAEYVKVAEKILRELSTSEYLAEPGTNFGFLLKHSTGFKGGDSEVDAPLTYADYYYLEALLRYSRL